MSKLAFRAQTVDIAYLPLRQGFLGKRRFNDRSKGFLFGQQPLEALKLGCDFGFRPPQVFHIVTSLHGFDAILNLSCK